MVEFDFSDAMQNAKRNARRRRYPSLHDSRVKTDPGLILPILRPRFKLRRGMRVFTIGSCFARNIEEKLTGFDLPTLGFKVPRSEWWARPNGLLNEYNPGSMRDRIWSIRHGRETSELIVPVLNGWVDLLLHSGSPVTKQRASERQQEIDNIYRELPKCDAVIITLGLIEAWFCKSKAAYLNQMPPIKVASESEGEYVLRQLDAAEAYDLLDQTISEIISFGIGRVIVTVSPVPLRSTFLEIDAVLANSYSKSVLRVCAQRLYDKYREVDYFPSYEIVTTSLGRSYENDNIHVQDTVVEHITNYMMELYTDPQ